MSQRKADHRIGFRAAECVRERFGRKTGQFSAASEIDRRTVYAWELGTSVPSARALQAMCELGFDVVYILTGRRSEDEQP